jgi:hypothetical protein
MNLRRALARDMRDLRSSRQTSTMAWSTGRASPTGTHTPRSSDSRGQVESPPPTRTPKPGRPSRREPTRAMQWISGALHWCGQAEMVILCFLGRSEYSRFSMKKRVTSSISGWTPNSSSPSIPATGQPVMVRTLSPQAPTVVSPAASRIRITSGSSASWIQWS